MKTYAEGAKAVETWKSGDGSKFYRCVWTGNHEDEACNCGSSLFVGETTALGCSGLGWVVRPAGDGPVPRTGQLGIGRTHV
jgi:hypothetical protein